MAGYIDKMEDAKLLKVHSKSSRKNERYECLVCQEFFSKIALRFHVNDFTHKQKLISHLGVRQDVLSVNNVENWSFVKKWVDTLFILIAHNICVRSNNHL